MKMHLGKPHATRYSLSPLSTFYLLSPPLSMYIIDVKCFSLSSTPLSTNDGGIIVCPDTTVTITCTANQVATMTWFEQSRQIDLLTFDDYEREETGVFHHDPYTITLAIDNIMNVSQGHIGDFTSMLEVNAVDVDNGTVITCAIFQNSLDLIIYIASMFLLIC